MTSIIKSTVPILFIILCLAAVPSMVVADTPSNESQDIAFEHSLVQEETGDIASIPVYLPPGEQATLSITGHELDQEVRVRDENSDGHVVVRINTYRENQTAVDEFTAAGSDSIVFVDGSSPSQLREGNYQLELLADGNSEDHSLLEISPGQFRDASVQAAPMDSQYRGSAHVQQAEPVNNSIARGDVAVLSFNAEGIAGVGNYENPPGENLVYADTSLPNESSTHTVQASESKLETRFSTVSVEYANGNSQQAPELSNAMLDSIGIDTDGDGQIERDLEPSVVSASTDDGTILFTLDSTNTIKSNETLLVKYSGVINPDIDGDTPVEVEVGSHTVTGNITYGVSGYGEFGNGIDVDIDSSTESSIVGPMSYDYRLDEEEDWLHVIVPTGTLNSSIEEQSINVSVRKTEFNANGNVQGQQHLSSTFQLVDREATIDVTNQSIWSISSSQTTMTGETTLAPGSEINVIVGVHESTSPEIHTLRTTVGSSQEFAVNVDLLQIINSGEIRVVVEDRNSQISKSYILTVGS